MRRRRSFLYNEDLDPDADQGPDFNPRMALAPFIWLQVQEKPNQNLQRFPDNWEIVLSRTSTAITKSWKNIQTNNLMSIPKYLCNMFVTCFHEFRIYSLDLQ